jgi:hypothetical protein
MSWRIVLLTISAAIVFAVISNVSRLRYGHARARRLRTFEARVEDKTRRVRTFESVMLFRFWVFGLIRRPRNHYLLIDGGRKVRVRMADYDSIDPGDAITVSEYCDGSIRLEPRH